MSLGDVNLECAWALVDALVGGGMAHACVSPGSRSTPLALALDRHPSVTTHVHLDERSSAFFALGIAKATGKPVGVACTSGTAAAELFPAVVEASQSRVPLVLLTADRPPRLRGTGANQTIDQVELYGKYVRADLEPSLPATRDDMAAWAGIGDGAIRAVAGLPIGPVHVNCPFDEPLVPAGEPTSRALPRADRSHRRPWEELVLPEDIEQAARHLSGARGVVVAGGFSWGGAELIVDLADLLEWPVLAEAISGGRIPERALSAGPFLLGSEAWLEANRPEVVLQVGAVPTTRAVQSLVASVRTLLVVDVHHPEPDPDGRATWRLRAQPEDLARLLLGRPFARDGEPIALAVLGDTAVPSGEDLEAARIAPSPGGWRAEWLGADARARAVIDEMLGMWDEPFEGRVARDLAGAIPKGGTLVVGSSMPIRDLDHFMAPRVGLRVLANRGASGIDGFVSTALGIAAAGAPTYALCGDLTFLHDVGALFWNARRGLDIVFVVLNNGGGTIFGFLRQRGLPEFERLFETPHGMDLGAICAAAGAGHSRIERAGELIPAVGAAAAGGGVHVVEVLIDPELDRARHGEVQAAVDEALRALA
jgi:2-succinyl-5-enolpyruvyl-6-hydroxy-3-cyclohexene-1-carboxylate synthase